MIAFIDLETTSANVETARIVEIGVSYAGGVTGVVSVSREPWSMRLNPGEPIPAEATEIHGITDAHVADCPTFSDAAKVIVGALADCDFAGYNILRFDLPVLQAEFRRLASCFELADRKIIDVCRLYHQLNPRDLSACFRRYIGRPLEGAHGALTDAAATRMILAAMLCEHGSLPPDVDALDEMSREGKIDLGGWFEKQADGHLYACKGKHKGKPARRVPSDYWAWLLKQDDVPTDTREIVKGLLGF